MTSFAFILGVLPLAFATGAGAGARNSVGTAVAGGMLASTILSIVFIPVLYVVIRTLAPGRAHRDRATDGRSDGTVVPSAVTGIVLVVGLSIATPAFAQQAACREGNLRRSDRSRAGEESNRRDRVHEHPAL